MTLQPQPASASVHLGVKRPANDISPVRSPSRIATPPPPDRLLLQARRSSRFFGRASTSTSGVDPESLSRALSRELTADRRDSAPAASPVGKRRRIDAERRIDGDRLVHAISSIVPILPRGPSSFPRAGSYLLTSVDLYPLDLAKISKLVSPFSMQKVHQPAHHGGDLLPMVSFIFREVGYPSSCIPLQVLTIAS